MNRNYDYQAPYPDEGTAYDPQGSYHSDTQPLAVPQYHPQYEQSQLYTSHGSSSIPPHHGPWMSEEARLASADNFERTHPNDIVVKQSRTINKKWQRRLYWMVPLGIIAIVLVILFEVYKADFERWVQPLADWLQARESWSWVIPVAILTILSFPPLFGHELIQIIVGLTYPIGVAIGIACAGSILGEAACFVVFKYCFTSYVDKKIASKIRWAAIARVAKEAGFRGVLVIRYSIVPPHLANPLFSCTGMKFWLYMITVILSLPKSIVFVVLGTGTNSNTKAAKWGKVIAVGVLIAVTVFASIWIRKKIKIATEEIEAERGEVQGDEYLEMGSLPQQPV